MERRRDIARAAAYVAARRGELGLTQVAFAQASGIDVKTVYNLESASRWPQARNRSAIESGLGWQAGDLQRIAEGGEPTPPLRQAGTPPQETAPVQRWFLSELRRRKVSLDDLTTTLQSLRVIAEHNGQTLAELLLESGLVGRDELSVRDETSPLKDAITRFHSEVEGITASPHLSARQRRQIEDRAAEELQRIREEIGGDA